MIFLATGGLVSLLIGFLVDQQMSLGMIAVVLGSAFIVAEIYYRWIRARYELKEIGS